MNLHQILSTTTTTVLLALSHLPSCFAAKTNDNDGAILVLGDSWASASESYLENVCNLGNSGDGDVDESELRAITNKGKAGSEAQEWASGELAIEPIQNAEYDYDYVWLSIGGNDFNCDPDKHDDIANNILQVISDIFESSKDDNDGIRVLYTGYGFPSVDICFAGETVLVQLLNDLKDKVATKIGESDYADKVTVMDVSSLYVTDESSPLSDTKWYFDAIHINEDGYEKLFSLPKVQEFFGCESGGPDSSSSPTHSKFAVHLSIVVMFGISMLHYFI